MKIVKWNSFGALTIAVVLSGIPVVFLTWVMPFVIGMICAEKDFFCRINRGSMSFRGGAVAMAFIGFYFRKEIILDGFISIVFIVAIFSLCDFGWIRAPLSYLGHHSMNIFYVHTFYRSTWFGYEFFSNQNPLFAFVLLLAVSLLTSVVLNKLKGIFRRLGQEFWYNHNSDNAIVNLI